VGRWWDTVPREQWPEWQAEAIAADFEGEEGDRRQEIVFIGLGMDTARAKITKALDGCLLTDEEMAMYKENAADLQELVNRFPNPLPVKSMQ
jgi:hypothetical protein